MQTKKDKGQLLAFPSNRLLKITNVQMNDSGAEEREKKQMKEEKIINK